MINCNQIDKVKKFLTEKEIFYESDILLKDFSYFKTGGWAKIIIYPDNEDLLSLLLSFMYKNKFSFKTIGDTSNILFLDDCNYGIFISLQKLQSINYYYDENKIVVQAGVSLPYFTRKALLWEVSGFEGLEGIPGSLGGAVFMNAGAYGNEIKDHLINVEGFHRDGTAFNFSNKECNFLNRDSIFRKNNEKYIIVTVSFSANKGNANSIYQKMELYHSKRHKYQDFMYPSLGSIFSTNDLYYDLASTDLKLKFFLKWYRRIFYSNKIRRETPINRKKLNNFICNYYKWNFDKQPFSDKTMNCITNRGQHTDDFISYINLLKSKLPKSIKIENEIMENNFFKNQ